ncbi:hypothetical protein [Pseudomonas putida]|uniref:Flagellar protein FliT n=1 Tax=Pseudomonas putida TaxID=303 RepID=A0A8I1EAS9_PSEPU|nr:hypothetical protein [Pseudomonas putida]MBI6882537.1 hypothetical protein [Pseudomonas putida]
MTAPIYRRLDTYRDILNRSRQMVELAASGQWEELIELQVKTGFTVSVPLLQHVDKHHVLSDGEGPEAAQLMKAILDCWADLQSKMINRQKEIAHLIESAKYQEAHGGLGKVVRTNTYSRDDLYRNKSR